MTVASQFETSGASGRSTMADKTWMLRKLDHIPQLLVSIRSVEEARRALAGGVEILDVKEPKRGSLGMADLEEIAQIVKLGNGNSGIVPISIALGEIGDWSQTSIFPTLPSGITFAKLGLSQCAGHAQWRADWQRIRAGFERHSLSKINWVAVAYADSTEAVSPSIEAILNTAVETGCAGLLIDTWSKSGLTLLDRIDAIQLAIIANDCHKYGLFFALAGKLRGDMLPALVRIPADVIAIRSAACQGTDRTSELDTSRVSDFGKEMRNWFSTTTNFERR